MRTTNAVMRATTILLGCCLWLSLSHANAPADAPEVRQLLANARYWTEHNRPDLARQLMRKLLAIHPRHPRALQALGLAIPQPPTTGATRASTSSPTRTPRSKPVAKKKRSPVALPPPEAFAPPAYDMAERVEMNLNPPDVTRLPALELQDAGEPDQARLGLEQALGPLQETSPALQWGATQSRRDLRALDDRQQPELAAGVTLVHKPGDGALSRLDSRVASLRLRQPGTDHGHWFGQIDTVRLDAGQASTTQLSRNGDWGSAALPHAPSLNGLPMHAHAQGTALIVGYDADHWRADLGTTPVGFEFSSISAGLGVNGRLGTVDWSLSLAHRPVTDSLLSYGGQRDLFSGIRWGAVRRTSALLHLTTVWKGLEPFAQLEGAAYRGREVLPNSERAAALGVDWVLNRGANHHLAVGSVFRFRAFDNNQNHYSVGHGGYYSPQSSNTVSVPMHAAMRGENLSWLLRVAPSWSHSNAAAAPRFPARADLQARAVAQGSETYGASRGSGTAWALQGTWEYRMNAHWATGLRVAAERSPDYARDQIHLYLRWHEKPQRGPVPLWPSTVMPHAGI